MTATINGKLYKVQFSYRRRDGKNATLGPSSPVRGLTACAIVCDAPNLVSVAAVLCQDADQWSRREGRRQAFTRAVVDCGILREEAPMWDKWFDARFPIPAPPHKNPKFPPSAEEIERRRQCKVREQRGVREGGCL